MSEPARERKERESGKPPTISLSELKDSVQHQPYHEKLFTWAGIVYLGASILPWYDVRNGWSSSSALLLTSLTVAIGLACHVLALQGLGPARSRGFWKIYRWVACAQLAIFAIYLVIHVPLIGTWEIGLVLACLSLPTMHFALYRMLESRGLLPFTITR